MVRNLPDIYCITIFILFYFSRYNNDLLGRTDHLTLHGGCPVLAGSKWITNKWFTSHAQMRNYPCPLEIRKDILRIKPINNDLCKMLPQCNNVDNLELLTPTEQFKNFLESTQGLLV